MIILLDNILYNYLNIISALVLISIFKLNLKKCILFVIIDIVINYIPIVSLLTIILYYLNKLIFKYFINNNINKCIFITIYYFIFITLIYFIFNYNIDYIYFIKSNILSHIFNIIIYFIYISSCY